MGAFNEENNIALLSTTIVDHSGAAQTTLYTVLRSLAGTTLSRRLP